jgi:hypothetical protein
MNVTNKERSGYFSLSNTFYNHTDEMVWADRKGIAGAVTAGINLSHSNA